MEKHDTRLVDEFIDMYKNNDNRKLFFSKLYSATQSTQKHSTNKVGLNGERIWSRNIKGRQAEYLFHTDFFYQSWSVERFLLVVLSDSLYPPHW